MKNKGFFTRKTAEYHQWLFLGLGFIVLCHILRLILVSFMKE